MKRYQWEQEQVAKTKSFIARFGSGSRASQAQSREKTLAKMMESGLTEKVIQEKVRKILFCPSFSFQLHIFSFSDSIIGISGSRKNSTALFDGSRRRFSLFGQYSKLIHQEFF